MYKYRAKKTDAYLECRKRANQLYYAKKKDMISINALNVVLILY